MATSEKIQVGLIILAAGASVRMKEPKQLLIFENKTLLRRTVEIALATVFKPVIVVLGANYERMSGELKGLPVTVCLNKDYENGLSSSIKTGLQKLLEVEPQISGVLLTLADQPLITTQKLNVFFDEFLQHQNSIIAAEYHQKIGVPALFNRQLFEKLFELEGDQGAREILRDHHRPLIKIVLPEAEFDIDTPTDFLELKKLDN